VRPADCKLATARLRGMVRCSPLWHRTHTARPRGAEGAACPRGGNSVVGLRGRAACSRRRRRVAAGCGEARANRASQRRGLRWNALSLLAPLSPQRQAPWPSGRTKRMHSQLVRLQLWWRVRISFEMRTFDVPPTSLDRRRVCLITSDSLCSAGGSEVTKHRKTEWAAQRCGALPRAEAEKRSEALELRRRSLSARRQRQS
jgi:hypothetical protein